MATVKEYFEVRARGGTWASLYDAPLDARTYNFITRRQAVERLLQADGRYAQALDIGCGTGDYAQVVWRHNGVYHGLDFSAMMITQAGERLQGSERPYELAVGSGEQLPYRDDTFDLVLALGYIEYFHDPTMTLTEIRRVLKPGGTLIIQSFKRELCGNVYRVLLSPLRRAAYVLGGKPLPVSMDVDRPYSPRQLDQLVGQYGFARRAHLFNHFSVLPDPFRAKFSGLYARASEFMQRTNPEFWSFLAINYIGKYVLNKASGT